MSEIKTLEDGKLLDDYVLGVISLRTILSPLRIVTAGRIIKETTRVDALRNEILNRMSKEINNNGEYNE
jgi:hypothetical protein